MTDCILWTSTDQLCCVARYCTGRQTNPPVVVSVNGVNHNGTTPHNELCEMHSYTPMTHTATYKNKPTDTQVRHMQNHIHVTMCVCVLCGCPCVVCMYVVCECVWFVSVCVCVCVGLNDLNIIMDE